MPQSELVRPDHDQHFRWACFQAFRDVVPGHAGEARFAAPGKPPGWWRPPLVSPTS